MGCIVETAQGRLEGFDEPESGLRVFLGIPFARPPVGRLRFRPPAPPESWAGVRQAREFGPSAPQLKLPIEQLMPGFDVGEQSEDCLYLNVYTPACDAARRPVLVWIHGGAYTLGSASQRMYDWRALAREGDLVLVTTNYRLGALAFLHLAGLDERLDTSACAGNRDQAAALRWVQGNIAAFGGDPAAVTVFGESAGGFSVGTLLSMPETHGLFRGAIPQSGAAHWVNDEETGTRVAELFLEKLGVPKNDPERVWDAPADAILKAQVAVEAGVAPGTHSRPFRPVVGRGALDRVPIEGIRSGSARDVRVMVGACRDEEKLFSLWDAEARDLDEAGLEARVERSAPGQGRRLVEVYRQARAARGADTSPFELWCAIATDLVFRIPAVRLAEAQARHQPDTWIYLMTWESSAMDGKLGACHGIDLPFVSGAARQAEGAQRGAAERSQQGQAEGAQRGAAERSRRGQAEAAGSRRSGAGFFAGSGPGADRLSREMMGAWIAFAREGDPNHGGLVAWPRHDEERRATLFFGSETRVVEQPLEAERRAWEGIL